MSRRSVLREPELVQMLGAEPELLALADALVETHQERRARSVKRRRRLVVAAAVVAAIALVVAAVSIAGGSLLGFSNQGTRVHAGPSVRHLLEGRLFKQMGLPFNTERPDSFRRLALRQGIGIYTARTKKGNHRCYYAGQRQSIEGQPPNKLYLNGYGCDPFAGQWSMPERIARIATGGRKAQAKGSAWLRAHPFPSSARPVLDMSGVGSIRTRHVKGYPTTPLLGDWPSISSITGLAADGVHSVQVLALYDCHPVVTVPVINNVYIDAHPPAVVDAFLVARDAKGKIIWHSSPFENPSFTRIPTERKLPRNCGLG